MRLAFLLIAIVTSSVSFGQTEREKKMLDEINYVRTQPKKYAEYINSYLDHWDSGSSERRTAEELRKQLLQMKPLKPLAFSKDLYDAAKKHGDWMKRTRRFEHSDLPYGENLVAGDSIIRFAMLNLLIDDGIPNRGHRKNILSPEYTETAAYEILGKVGSDTFVFIQEFN